MQRRILGRLVGASLALTGCMYLAPVNRRPGFKGVHRLCDAAQPVVSCTDGSVRYGEVVTVEALIVDPDGPAGTEHADSAQWRISACGGPSDDTCSTDRLYDGRITTPMFTVPRQLDGTGPLVSRIAFDVQAYDERGASSSGRVDWSVQEPPGAPSISITTP